MYINAGQMQASHAGYGVVMLGVINVKRREGNHGKQHP